MHGPTRITVEMALRPVRREEVVDTGAGVADGVVAGERGGGGGRVGVVAEWVGDCAGVAVDFCKVAAFRVGG